VDKVFNEATHNALSLQVQSLMYFQTNCAVGVKCVIKCAS